MELLQNHWVQCAFCGESIEVLIDCSVADQEYVEDCQVCCRPLVFTVLAGHGEGPDISVRYENE